MSDRNIEDGRQALLNAGHTVGARVKRTWEGFKDFALRDNVLEVAVGLILAAAFTKVVTSLVSDVILPVISLLPFISRNLPDKFWVLKKGPHASPRGQGYNTLQQASDDGAVTLAYGIFIDNIVNFIGIGMVLYGMASFYGWVSHDSIITHTRKCPQCRKTISAKAKRCAFCTSWTDGRDDQETSAL
ncbi:ion channel [Punctularia strigosozonata HHB-11173 SS5]|uniref:ion channel n=1 Tax=Punctularia strigosozonata (strain HHB-11173) TaxID=741275 RepID=UPI0004418398|nr:ion channel [Punctularia strigosozonata HHB-11173 SS5]EIN11047.1 ion channel [Punctularia strigosozonata HHB-11173 SS5]